MQITIKIKGLLKIAIVFAVVIPCVLYGLFMSYRSVSYRIKKYQEDKYSKIFDYKFTTDDPSQKGYILTTSSVPSAKLIIMDLAGHVIFKQGVNGEVCDFRQWHINGHTLYSYAVSDTNKNTRAIAGSTGHFVILDSSLHEIRQVHLLPFNDITTDKKQDLDVHDFIMLGDDHFMVMTAYTKSVDNIPTCLFPSPNIKVAAVIVEEIKNDSVVWQWDATRFPEFYLNSQMLNKFYDTTAVQDYVHINAMVIDPHDSNLILSFRNENQLVKINRHTGDIMWRLGGKNSDFPLTADQQFMGQHNPTFIENQKLLLFDNGVYAIRPYSRVVEFQLDEQNKKIISFKAWKIPEEFSNTKGSVQKIGEDYFVCGGSGKYLLRANSITGTKKMEILTNQMTLYRAYLVNDIKGIQLNQK